MQLPAPVYAGKVAALWNAIGQRINEPTRQPVASAVPTHSNRH
jgi:hypothetical protein